MAYKGFLDGILAPLLQRLEGDGGLPVDIRKELGKGRAAIYQLLRFCTPPAKPNPPGGQTMQINWLQLALGELERFNKDGTETITSVAEAVFKVEGIMNQLYQSKRSRFYFRGECDFSWDLTPRITRKRKIHHDPTNPLTVSKQELDSLRIFQSSIQDNPPLAQEIFSRSILPDSDTAWWATMQHYDEECGTRMIDITSSVFCGLYFACADWKGAIDPSTDGALYLFPDESEWLKAPPSNIADANLFFNVTDPVDFIRFYTSATRNDRMIAQDGFFLWQPRFDQPLKLHHHFKFRVTRHDKPRILQELYSIGYTATRIVRGTLGQQAHANLCSQLGLHP